jgi:hypothetical protein
MPLIFTRTGKRAILTDGRQAVEGVRLRLFTNDYTPTDLSDALDYKEADFPGYAPVVISGWTRANVAPDGSVFISAPQAVFRCTAAPAVPQRIYGYFCTGVARYTPFAERVQDGMLTVFARDQVLRYFLNVSLDNRPF